jgi:hypothetical protein
MRIKYPNNELRKLNFYHVFNDNKLYEFDKNETAILFESKIE